MTAWTSHCKKWKDGCGAEQCQLAKQVVLARGVLPCDVLFVGEAPGESENVLGRPFVGPAGHLLDKIVARAMECSPKAVLPGGPVPWTVAMTNLVACIPRESDGDKAGEPTPEQIQHCSARLMELVEMAKPRLIVAVGKLASDHLTPGFRHSVKVDREIPRCHLTHPAAILRAGRGREANLAQRGLMIQRCVVTLTNALDDLSERRETP